jgi:hypothetical protein
VTLRKSNDEKSIFENDLKLNEDNKLVFKCNHYISKGNRNIETIRRDFIDQIILKLNERFPKEDSNIVYAIYFFHHLIFSRSRIHESTHISTIDISKSVFCKTSHSSVMTGKISINKYVVALRHDRLENIQKLLDEATLKIREVHEVRWMSIYKAVETVYCMTH